MPVHVLSFEFVVTSGVLEGQRGTEDAYAYAFDAVGNNADERRYRAFRVANLGADRRGLTPLEIAKSYAREFGSRHGNVRIDTTSSRCWPLAEAVEPSAISTPLPARIVTFDDDDK